jgi:phage terminase large subunit-like protein
MRMNPRYLSELNSLPEHERDMQLYGNWYAKPKGQGNLEEEYLNIVDEIPVGSVAVRSWDKAYEEVRENNKTPDFTASIKMWKTPEGRYILAADWDLTIVDRFIKEGEDTFYGKFREKSGKRNELILRQAEYDGHEVMQVIPYESGPARGEFDLMVNMFAEAGIKCKGIPTGNKKGAKKIKFDVFCSVAQNGLVDIHKASFPNEYTYRLFIKELVNFDGSRSGRLKKDDWVDCVSDAFEACRNISAHTAPARLNISSRTKLHRHKEAMRR